MKKIKDRISNFYNKLIKTKEHIWSHCLALTGWGILFFIILIKIISSTNNNFLFKNLSYIMFTSIIISIIILIFIIIKICFPHFKIKQKIILTNSIYHLFWLFGFIILVVFSILIILHPLYATLIHIFTISMH